MSKLRKNDIHNCPFCDYPSKRGNIKTHLTKPKKDGKPRCAGLKTLIPVAVWNEVIFPYYTNGAKLPELLEYTALKRSPGKPKKCTA